MSKQATEHKHSREGSVPPPGQAQTNSMQLNWQTVRRPFNSIGYVSNKLPMYLGFPQRVIFRHGPFCILSKRYNWPFLAYQVSSLCHVWHVTHGSIFCLLCCMPPCSRVAVLIFLSVFSIIRLHILDDFCLPQCGYGHILSECHRRCLYLFKKLFYSIKYVGD